MHDILLRAKSTKENPFCSLVTLFDNSPEALLASFLLPRRLDFALSIDTTIPKIRSIGQMCSSQGPSFSTSCFFALWIRVSTAATLKPSVSEISFWLIPS